MIQLEMKWPQPTDSRAELIGSESRAIILPHGEFPVYWKSGKWIIQVAPIEWVTRMIGQIALN